MRHTSLKSGQAFSESYGIQNGLVVYIGKQNVNSVLRSFFETKGMNYVCVDIDEDSSANIVTQPREKLPFEDSSVDLIVSTSWFEEDPYFGITFTEMTRIVKPFGYIYINAPASGPYHTYPGDNLNFYSNGGQVLAYWSGKQMSSETIYPVKVVEIFNVLGDELDDFVCVWKRVNIENIEQTMILDNDVINNIGILEQTIHNYGLQTRKKS